MDPYQPTKTQIDTIGWVFLLSFVSSLIFLGYIFGSRRREVAVKDLIFEIEVPIDDAWYPTGTRMRARRRSETSSSRGTQADAMPGGSR
ncbi:uncharacterized protein UTRI_01549_B [Ustilago trichophora]|uniref:Uncharacterized protein n=1 Tax=Ustilago trichophora TaxID=86804 RepID=A0A5C3E634_9BASI|nr:uncharacterized protein UTRI_01549_B [Ustilago trichophora]